ncbi:MAG: hypothetical protein NC483_07090 [Ruminococcus sp.]|nr:hypothetical protein [Ruminococcus sp.]
MKRVGLVLGSIVAVTLLTGCGGKEKALECTMSENKNGVEANQVYTLNFNKKGKFASAKLVQDMKLDESLTSYLSTYKETFEESLKSNATTKDLPMEITDNGTDTITATITFDANDATKISGSDASSATYDVMKDALEDAGYTCK